MIKLHQSLISTSSSDLPGFLSAVVENEHINNLENVVVVFEDYEPKEVFTLKEALIAIEKQEKEPITYDGLTGIKYYGGTGIALFDKGEETSLSSFTQKAIKEYAKKNWKEGIMFNWEEEAELPEFIPTRDSYSWK